MYFYDRIIFMCEVLSKHNSLTWFINSLKKWLLLKDLNFSSRICQLHNLMFPSAKQKNILTLFKVETFLTSFVLLKSNCLIYCSIFNKFNFVLLWLLIFSPENNPTPFLNQKQINHQIIFVMSTFQLTFCDAKKSHLYLKFI